MGLIINNLYFLRYKSCRVWDAYGSDLKKWLLVVTIVVEGLVEQIFFTRYL